MNTKTHQLETRVSTNQETKSIDIELRVDGGLIFGRAVQHKRDVQGLIIPITVALMTAGVPDAIVWETAKQAVTRVIERLKSLDTLLRDKPLQDPIMDAIIGSQHVTVYGPAASGKTYNAVKLATFFRCNVLMDEPTSKDLVRLPFIPKALVLNHTPVKGTINIAITDALQAAGLRGPSKYFGPTDSLEKFLGTITADQATPKIPVSDIPTAGAKLGDIPKYDQGIARSVFTGAKRKLTDHLVNPCNEKITITVLDEPGDGGANHLYLIEGVSPAKNKSWKGRKFRSTAILFQNGPIPANGTNGITQEVLLAIVADRLRGFQSGPFACKDNACALTHIEEALMWLQRRTHERTKRGVEGTHKL
jgi:hypothetical protein